MGKSKKKRPTSPPNKIGRANGRGTPTRDGDTPRTGVVPLAYDNDKFDNEPLTITLVFPGEESLSMAFPPVTVPAKSFCAGADEPPTHTCIETAIYESLYAGLACVCDLTKSDAEMLHKLVKAHYHTSRTNDTTFTFSVLKDGIPALSFVGATKYLHHSPTENGIVACLVPDIIKYFVWETTSSTLLDHPEDSLVEDRVHTMSPRIKTAYKEYKKLSALPNSPVRRITRFSETVFMNLDGSWNSSINLYAAVDPNQDPNQDQDHGDTSSGDNPPNVSDSLASGPGEQPPTNESSDATIPYMPDENPSTPDRDPSNSAELPRVSDHAGAPSTVPPPSTSEFMSQQTAVADEAQGKIKPAPAKVSFNLSEDEQQPTRDTSSPQEECKQPARDSNSPQEELEEHASSLLGGQVFPESSGDAILRAQSSMNITKDSGGDSPEHSTSPSMHTSNVSPIARASPTSTAPGASTQAGFFKMAKNLAAKAASLASPAPAIPTKRIDSPVPIVHGNQKSRTQVLRPRPTASISIPTPPKLKDPPPSTTTHDAGSSTASGQSTYSSYRDALRHNVQGRPTGLPSSSTAPAFT